MSNEILTTGTSRPETYLLDPNSHVGGCEQGGSMSDVWESYTENRNNEPQAERE
jgi:hypothetical protein